MFYSLPAETNAYGNIVAAFWGMHVLPAKHSFAWLPRKCDYRTDRHTDGGRQTDSGQSDHYVQLCFAGDTINELQSLTFYWIMRIFFWTSATNMACQHCTRDSYSSGHLIPSHLGLACKHSQCYPYNTVSGTSLYILLVISDRGVIDITLSIFVKHVLYTLKKNIYFTFAMDLYIGYRHWNCCYLWRVRNEQCPYKTCQDICEEFFSGTTNKKTGCICRILWYRSLLIKLLLASLVQILWCFINALWIQVVFLFYV